MTMNNIFTNFIFNKKTISVFLLATSITLTAQTAVKSTRWTGIEDQNTQLDHIVSVINQKLNLNVQTADFQMVEERDLATSHFQTYFQIAGGIPMRGASLRVWSDPQGQKAIQVEAFIEDTPPATKTFLSLGHHLILRELTKGKDSLTTVRKWLRTNAEDKKIRSIKSSYFWMNSKLVREFTVKARLGTHLFLIDVQNNKLIKHQYQEYPNGDNDSPDVAGEFKVPARVYPIYDFADSDDGTQLIQQDLQPTNLKYLKSEYTQVNEDPYSVLRNRKYTDAMADSFMATTAAGQAQGYWSSSMVKMQARSVLQGLRKSQNSFTNGGVILDGRYATVSIHPDFVKSLGDQLPFVMKHSAQLHMSWNQVSSDNGEDQYEMVPGTGYLGRPLKNWADAWNRPATQDPDNNPLNYLKQGFDEVQVYYAITRLFESLHGMGFTDPDLSSRPFHAFLYDPDIGARDNAYYTDDTINFSTYSKGHRNFARDNSTIWHELGHGIMDRLMGDYITLADTGGLSEGMADFVAALVIADVSNGLPFDGSQTFRIINRTGFGLTNEVHDDGESYGGAMNDLLEAAIKSQGRQGLIKVGDLTMETMRLTRNHPALTAQDWFSHMLFADEMGHPGVRESGEMKTFIMSALDGRNFRFANGTQNTGAAEFSLKNGDQEITAGAPGSRGHPVGVTFVNGATTADYNLQVQLKDGEVYKFQYPVTIVVQYQGGPLQGALHWTAEDKVASETYTIENPEQLLQIPLQVSATCDYVNRPDNGCSDFVYIKIFNKDTLSSFKPVAKKRFYLKVTP